MDGWLGPLWNNLGWTYWALAAKASDGEQAGKYNRKALECYLKARQYHWKHGGEMQKLKADWAVGSTYRRLGQYDQASAWLRPVLAWAERVHQLDPGRRNIEWVGWANYELGMIALEQRRPGNGLAQLKTAKEQFRKSGLGEGNHPEDWQKVLEAVARAERQQDR